MKHLFLCALIFGMSAGASYAQTNDTIQSHQLDEVVVNAKLNRIDAEGVYFIPSGRQKNSAQNGIDLLRSMAIPQIKVNLADDNVQTNTGAPVPIYINYVKASPEELEGLKTTDVRKVEYFYSPSDQRFMGERNVINIIVQPYVYGGYTKLSLQEIFLIGLSNSSSVYSKFTYKKMTFDLFVGARNFNTHHSGFEKEGQYCLMPNSETKHWIERTQTPYDMKFVQNIFPVSLRAAYSKRGFQMKNTLAFSFQDIPESTSDGVIGYHPLFLQNREYQNYNTSRGNILSYNGNFNFNLPRHYYLTITPKASYSHNRQRYSFISNDSRIINNAKEDNYSLSIMAMGRKIMSDVHYLFVRGFGGHTNYKVSYSGSTSAIDRITESYGGASFQYGYYTNSLTADLMVGVRGEKNITNDKSETELYPFASANFGWSPNAGNSLTLGLSYSKEPMASNIKSPNVLQENELMYYCGNPSLKYSPNIMVNLGYNCSPNSWLQISPFAQFFGIFDRYVPVYSSFNEGNAIIRRYENNGDHFRTQIGVALTAKLLEGNLQFQVAPSQFLYKSTGYYDITYRPFALSGSVVYYLDKFYFSGYYETRNRTLWTNSGTIYKDVSQVQISAGWSNSNLNIRLGVANPFRTSWKCSTLKFTTPVYKESQTTFGTTAHCNINLSVTYTIGYGKKVSRNNEIGEQLGTGSAILK